MHVDEWIERFDTPAYASLVLHFFRLPAVLQMKFADAMKQTPLFCTYEGERYRCTMASRFGDIGLTKNFARDAGYEIRVDVAECTAWGPKP